MPNERTMKGRCTLCRDPLWGAMVHLKLDGRTNTYTDEFVPAEHLRGVYPFGRICATKAKFLHRKKTERRSGRSSGETSARQRLRNCIVPRANQRSMKPDYCKREPGIFIYSYYRFALLRFLQTLPMKSALLAEKRGAPGTVNGPQISPG
jgi:hypothetical protein